MTLPNIKYIQCVRSGTSIPTVHKYVTRLPKLYKYPESNSSGSQTRYCTQGIDFEINVYQTPSQSTLGWRAILISFESYRRAILFRVGQVRHRRRVLMYIYGWNAEPTSIYMLYRSEWCTPLSQRLPHIASSIQVCRYFNVYSIQYLPSEYTIYKRIWYISEWKLGMVSIMSDRSLLCVCRVAF